VVDLWQVIDHTDAMTSDMVSRFYAKVDKREEHWIWTGMRNGRHGQFCTQRHPRNIRVPAHAFALRDTGIDIPDGATLIPVCGTELCVRPDHWRVGDRSELPSYSDDRAEARFWSKVRRADGDACWEWQGARRARGYGFFGRRGYKLAHRFAWEITSGPIPDGQFVCHRCDNPPCCRPDHLFLGTPADNSADMVAKGRTASPRGTAHGQARFTAEQVREMRRRYSDGGVSTHTLARQYDVGAMNVWRVVTGRSYRDVQ
jgi:hypothetical protein